MTLRVLEMPDAPADLAAWIDRELVGLGLAELVADLSVVHAKKGSNSPPTLAAALGDRLPAVLKGGLRQGTRSGLSLLLRHPKLLLELQERILTEGGAYWTNLARENREAARLASATLPDVAVSGQAATRAGGRAAARPGRGGSQAAAAAEAPPRPPKPPRVRLLRFWARVATVAASTLAFLYFCDNQEKILNYVDPERKLLSRLYPKGTSPIRRAFRAPDPKVVTQPLWGWSRSDVLTQGGSPWAYLNAIADAGGEWYDEVPFSSDALAKRLGMFRTGISRLRLADHAPLGDAEKTWLLDQLKDWADLVDAAVRAVEEGKSVDDVRNKMDDAVSLMVRTLRDRARLLESPEAKSESPA